METRAIVLHAAGDLRVETRAADVPGPGEVLVGIAAGGICGSDLHYFQHGGFGPVRLREPMILGHEVAGHVLELGPGVQGLAPGDLVAVSPSAPCGVCRFCAEGLANHCLDMAFYGSAMRFPHVQGAFRERLVASAARCVPAPGLSPGVAAMAEPLAVCLHAVRRAGEMLGRRVLVTGSGPIGVLCVLAARRAGAAEVVATDLEPASLAHALTAGADRVIDVAAEPDALDTYSADKGHFDVLLECSAAPAALAAGVAALRPRGVAVQVGMAGDATVPLLQVTVKEIDLRGTFRFHQEFAMAVNMMVTGRIDPTPLITHALPLARAGEAFELAADRSRAMKVQIGFAPGAAA